MKRLVFYGLLLAALNFSLLKDFCPSVGVMVAAGIFLGIFYLKAHFAPLRDSAPQWRMRILNGGCELMLAVMVCFTIEAGLYLWLLWHPNEAEGYRQAINGLVAVVLLTLLLINGLARILLCSKQLGLLPKLGLLFFWWMPVVNLLLLRRFFATSRAEYEFTVRKYHQNAERRPEQLCKTRYPLLMVHGIFFRDWKAFNYWGRISKELTDNGATLYYGSQQSSAAVEQCAQELQQCIRQIVEETGCEKVNIIAHSKGGLDCRYAISCLGAGDYVASLTTINTPHLGCSYVQKLLDILPHKFISALGKRYESIYTKLGDDHPDFFSGLKDLTDQECARLNSRMPDDPAVLYQSVGSQMHSFRSAMFPMNIGYLLIKLSGGGANDGLAAVKSMAWGNYLGTLKGRKQGISHGDMIDLTRKDVAAFDVCEFYVDLVYKIKLAGL